MPPFLDRVQLDHALHNEALPLLEVLAANNNLRDRALARFERDDPPPYAESTESEGFDDAPPPPVLSRKLPEELQSIMDQPIRTGELNPYGLKSTLRPGDVYYRDACREDFRVSRYRPNLNLTGAEGAKRLGVLVRHHVKHRWEQLGVWNSEWGFPGRELQPNDQVAAWKWPWRQHEADGPGPGQQDPYTQQLLARALRLRENLRRGESSPAIPRSHLKKDVSASEAESFIISRPWFIFEVEVAEERARYARLSEEHRRRYPYSARMQVIEWWKERGDWREEFNRTNCVTSWKWRHESSSPEPELPIPKKSMEDTDVRFAERSCITNWGLGRLGIIPMTAANMSFTPSEIGDLETIQLPYSEQPPGFWAIPESHSGLGIRHFPGQTVDMVARAIKIHDMNMPIPDLPGRKWPRIFPLDPPPPEEYRDTPPELPRPQQDTMSPPPSNSQCSNRRLPQVKVNKVQNEDNYSLPRRSARIASLKRPAEPLPSQTAPNKKLRGKAAPKAAATVIQHTTRETRRTRAGPVQSPPSRKESRGPSIGKKTRSSKPSAVTKKLADTGQPKARTSRGRMSGRKDGEAPAVTRRLRERGKRHTK